MCEVYEYAKVYSEGWRFARKPNRCDDCGCPILVGTRYHSFSGLYDGAWNTVATCYACKTLSKALDAIEHYHAVGYAWECIDGMGGADNVSFDTWIETKKGRIPRHLRWDWNPPRAPFSSREAQRRAWAARVFATAAAMKRGELIALPQVQE